MTIPPGEKVGPYEVIEPLGAGGMGQVFRARDSRLKRDVALKVLSIASGDSAEYRARFEREAQVLASLNHPRIAQVFGVEDYNGAPVIAMELVPGLTLAERIARGPIPVDEALHIAVEICDGLEAAHERGVIHRDLKPANIKIRPDGSVAILDFGLARATDTGSSVDPANSPTMMGGTTGVGVVMGTAAYMSPEQARARTVDKRADIWAFGCVLYEMLTGTHTFAGESTTDILAAVVQNDPDWTKLPESVPPRVVDLLHRCLEKNVKDRLRDIGDARYEIVRDRDRGQIRGQIGGQIRGQTRGLSLVLAAGAIVAAIAVFLIVARKSEVVSEAPIRTTIDLPPDTTLSLTRGSVVAISPDGRKLVFVARANGKTQLYLRSLDRFELQPIPGTDDGASPFFSPDGRWVGFFSGDKLKKVALDGGAPVALTDARAPRGEAWGDGDSIYVTRTNVDTVARVPAVGGKAEPVTSLGDGEMSHRWPHVLPDGKTLLFAIWNDNGWEPSRIAAQRLGSKDHSIIVEAGAGYPHVLRDPASGRSYLIYARAEGILAALFDEAKLVLASQPVPVVDSVVTNLSGGAHFDLSRTGTLAYVPGSSNEAARDIVWVDLEGKSEPLAGVPIVGRVYQLSPDGTRIVRQNPERATGGVWLQNIVTKSSVPLSTSPDDFAPVWARDGSFVVYTRGLRNASILRRQSPSSPEELLLTSAMMKRTQDVSPDGKTVLLIGFDPATGADIYVLPIDKPGGEPRAFVKTKFSEGTARFSPDGKWISYQSNESGRYEIYARSYPDGARTVQLSVDGGLTPEWSPTGRDLFYFSSAGKMMAIPIDLSSPDLVAGKTRALFDNKGYENQFYAVAPDGKRLLMMPLMKSEQSGQQIQLVMNFFAELRQRVK